MRRSLYAMTACIGLSSFLTAFGCAGPASTPVASEAAAGQPERVNAARAEAGKARRDRLDQAWQQRTPLSFSEVATLEVALRDRGTPVFIDFEHQSVLGLPGSIDADDPAAIRAWAMRNAVPLSFRRTSEGVEVTLYDASYWVHEMSVAAAQQETVPYQFIINSNQFIVEQNLEWGESNARRFMQEMYDIQTLPLQFAGSTEADYENWRSFQNIWAAQDMPILIKFWDNNGHLGMIQMLGYDEPTGTLSLRYKRVVPAAQAVE